VEVQRPGQPSPRDGEDQSRLDHLDPPGAGNKPAKDEAKDVKLFLPRPFSLAHQ